MTRIRLIMIENHPEMKKHVKTNHLEWFKRKNRYGARWSESREVAIPAEYACALYFNKKGYAVAWKDYKAGVIDTNNNVRIPFIYDEVYERDILVPNDNRRKIVDQNGEERFVDPEEVRVFHGYACFTNEGGEQAYDEDCNPCDFDEEDEKHMCPKYEWSVPENANRTLEEIEKVLKEDFRKLQDLQYNDDYRRPYRHGSTEEIDKLWNLVRGHIYDRRHVMNLSWVHNRENAERISRTNDLLMRAVKKAVKLGKKTQESLQWMNDVPNNYKFDIRVYIHPQWDNDKSSYDYMPKKGLSKKNEQKRLVDQIYNEADSHVWNIIAAMGEGAEEDGVSLCFYHTASDKDDKWNYKELIMDDGQSWDEGIFYPAYQDVYFTHPFHLLYLDSFIYSFEDLCNINDFRINVAVKLETKEQSKRGTDTFFRGKSCLEKNIKKPL